MKNSILKIFFAYILFASNVNAQTYYLPKVGFEDGTKPAGWDESRSSSSAPYWRYQNGGYTKSIIGHPPAAKTGVFNALFQAEEVGPSTKLITPTLNLLDATKPALNFWHAQESWSGSTDILKIYYRTSPSSGWVLIETYSLPTSGWVEREILLPPAAKVATCQLAFEGTTQWGWGVCLDDIMVVERAVVPRYVDNVSFKQKSNHLPSGSKVNPLGYVYAKVLGNDGNIPLNSITVNYSGTNISDISQFRLYHTRDSIFTIDSTIASTISISGNEISITPNYTFNLYTGANYFWISADINSGTSHGNTVDYTISTNKINLGGNYFPSTDQSPAGLSIIEESLFYDDFESSSLWTLNGDWAIGIPTGTGTYDPNHPYEGNKVLATKLDGNYSSNITLSNPHNATTPSKNLKYYQNVNLRYNRFLNIDYFDKARIKVSNNGGTTWSTVYENPQTINDSYWKSLSHNISNYATRKADVKVAIAIDTSNAYTEYGGWNIDNFALTGDFIASDVGVISMVAPISKCGLTSADTVKVTVKNYGGATVNTPFDVGYSLNNGATWVKESFTAPIDSEEEIVFTFDTPADFSAAGLKQLKFKTFLTGDEDTQNDSYSKSFYIFPEVGFPYQASFESSNGYWYSYGANSSWAWGTPAGTIINKASSGTKAWVTNLTQSYNYNELSYLESPCFDLSSALYPVLAFDYMLQTETGEDGFAIEYSIDGGLTWNDLNANANYSSNWYDTPSVTALSKSGWSQDKVNYVTVKNLLPLDVIGVNGVKFRFVFASNATNSYEGVSIDQFKLYELPNDISITALTSPTGACEIGKAVKLTFTVKNIGYRPMLNGQTIPLVINVDSTQDVNETITLSADLNKNDEISFETSKNYNLFSAKFHDITAYSNLTTEDDRTNDTLYTQVEVYGMPGYTLGPDIGTMNTDTLILVAGSDYSSYEWKTKIPASALDWTTSAVTNDTLEIGVNDWGLYAINILNARGCSAKDTIEIRQSDKNVGVTDILNISSACTHSTPINPQVTIKHFGASPFDGVESVPVAIMINGEEILVENYTPAAGWDTDDTYNYTFTGTIDISAVGDYSIAAYTKLAKDINKNNDTTSRNVSTYGLPDISLAYDTISSTQADTLSFSVEAGFASYAWEQKLLGQSTWNAVGSNNLLNLSAITNNLRSATYRITVTDTHGCGNDKDSLFVNAQDLGIFSIEEPNDTICYQPEGITFKMQLKNYGQDIYPTGTTIGAVLSTQNEQKNMNIVLESDLTPGNMTLVSFDEPIMLSPGIHFINISTSIDGDPNQSNDFIEGTFKIDTIPTVNIELDTLYKVFKSSTYLISPTYSSDCASYTWQDNSTDSTYLVSTPAYEIYKVIASNNHNCSASDSLVIISTDIGITAIKSPINKCELTDNTAVTITVINSGNKILNTGTDISVKLYVNSVLADNQTVELGSPLAVNESRDITLPGTINLAGLQNASIFVELGLVGITDVDQTNNTIDKMVYATGYPNVSLGVNREIHAFSDTLRPGSNFATYLWHNSSADSIFIASATGTYSVTVTDYNGCSGSATVDLTFYVDDIQLLSLNTPITGCNLSAADTVNITIKNNGTWTIPSGTILTLGFNQNNVTKTENFTLLSPLAPNSTLNRTLTNTMDFSVKKNYSVSAWAKLSNDMVTSNDTLKTQIEAYPNVLVNLGTDIISNKSEILDPGGGYNSYLWSTGATTQTLTVSTTGEYWVEVSNIYGCSARDTINYTFVAEPDLQLLSLTTANTSCSLSNAEEVNVEIKNIGNYVFTSGEQINLELQNNSTTIATETITLTENFAINDTIEYVFTHTLDLSAPSAYTIKVVLSQVKDTQAGNNTLQKSITVWGVPNVNLGNDTSFCTGNTLTLDAGNSGSTYLWSNSATSKTIDVNTSNIYWVDVTDIHSCVTRDSITVTVNSLPTVTHSALDPACYNDTPYALTGGSPAGGIYTGAGTSGTTFTASSAGVGTHTLTYTYTDANQCSSSTTVDITVNANPVVDLGDNQSITEPLTLNAGSGFASYKWQDNSTNQTFTVNQTGLYSVTVTNNNGCEGYDEVYITYQETLDIFISSLISPVNKCFDNVAQPVTVELTNRGNKTFTSGEQIEVSYRIGTGQPLKEQITFSSNFAQNDKLQHTFTGNVLQNSGNYTFTSYTTIAGDKGDSTTFDVNIYPLPNLNIGNDTLRTSLPFVLQSGIGNVTYLWSTGATSSSITVSQQGKYWLTVTDPHECVASDTVVILWPVSAEIISGIDAKIKLFPNPVKDELNVWIEASKAEVFTLELINPQGISVISKQTIQADKITDTISVNELTPGIYILKVSNGKGAAVFKLIKN